MRLLKGVSAEYHRSHVGLLFCCGWLFLRIIMANDFAAITYDSRNGVPFVFSLVAGSAH